MRINLNKLERTSLFDHHFIEGHVLNLENYTLLNKQNNYRKKNS